MSTQTNFFADDNDLNELHAFLRDTIKPLYFIRGERGTLDELAPALVSDDAVFRSCRKTFLFAETALTSIVYHDLGDVYPNQKSVDQNSSPVIEYSPCVVQNDGSLRVGRFYFAYRGRITREYKKTIRTVFSWVRAHSIELPGWKSFRILESASKTASLLRQWVGPPEPNPLFRGIGYGQCPANRPISLEGSP
jgi:hypothetical protein